VSPATAMSIPKRVKRRSRHPWKCPMCGKDGIGYQERLYCSTTCRVNAWRLRQQRKGYRRTRRGWERKEDAGSGAEPAS
jgi:hypothetical protein